MEICCSRKLWRSKKRRCGAKIGEIETEEEEEEEWEEEEENVANPGIDKPRPACGMEIYSYYQYRVFRKRFLYMLELYYDT